MVLDDTRLRDRLDDLIAGPKYKTSKHFRVTYLPLYLVSECYSRQDDHTGTPEVQLTQ